MTREVHKILTTAAVHSKLLSSVSSVIFTSEKDYRVQSQTQTSDSRTEL